MSNHSRDFTDSFQQLVDRWIDGNISPDELAELEAELSTSPEKQRYAAESLLFSEQLALEMETPQVRKPAPRELIKRRTLVLAAIGATFCFLILLVNLGNHAEPPGGSPDFAFIDRLENAEWLTTEQTPTFDSEVIRGESLKLAKGFVGVTFTNGTRLLIEGPSSLTIHDTHSVTLENGKLVLSLPAGSDSFSIESAGYQIQVASNSRESHEGNLYGLLYDRPKNLLQTSVYSGDVEIQPLADGKQATIGAMPVFNEVPIAESFSLALERTEASAAAHRLEIQLKNEETGDGFFQLIESSTSRESSPPSECWLKLFTEAQSQSDDFLVQGSTGRIAKKSDSFGCFAFPPDAMRIRLSHDHPMQGEAFLFAKNPSFHRSDFLGRWTISTHSAAKASAKLLRLRSDGSIVSESQHRPKTNWYFRAGLVYLIDSNGNIKDRWLPMDSDHLISEADHSVLIERY
tara:strand:+ start:16362 stop:17741 length:1380 start_codon:yes stop_codon:yes gene_type:complete